MALAVESLATSRRLPLTDLAPRLNEFRALIKQFASGDPEQPEQSRVLRRTLAAGASLVQGVVASAGLDADHDSELQRAVETLDLNRPPRSNPLRSSEFRAGEWVRCRWSTAGPSGLYRLKRY